jgi:DNA-binding transcriptional ArsR family regulator
VATLETLAALRAVADDQRSRILSVLIEAPLTAGELARRLGIARTRIYYNLDMLERHGIIRVVEERVVERRVERVYRAVARRYRVDADLLGRGRARPLARVRARIIEQVAIDMKELSRSPKADDPSVLVGRTRVKLRPARVAALRRALEALFQRYGKPDPDGVPIELAVALFPYAGLASDQE